MQSQPVISPNDSIVRRESQGAFYLSIYDVLKKSRITALQIAIVAFGSLSYAQCTCHVMLTSLSQDSLWDHWRWLNVNDSHVTYNSVIAGQAFANLVGNFYIMPLMDYYGRRNLFLFCNIVPLLMTLGSFWAPNFATYAVFRCLAVLISTTGGIAANVYAIEIVNPKLRPTVNWLQQAYCCVALIFMVVCKYLLEQNHWTVWDWLQIFTNIPTVIGIVIGIWTHVESPGYQLLYNEDGPAKAWKTVERIVGGRKELDRIVHEVQAENHGADPEANEGQALLAIPTAKDVEMTVSQKLETSPVRESLLVQRKEVHFVEEKLRSSEKRSVWTFIDVRPIIRGWYRLFANPKTRWDTIGLCVIWIGEAFCHWGIMSYCTSFYETVGYDANLMTILMWAIQIPIHPLILYLMTWMKNERLLIGIISAITVVFTLALAILLTLRNAGIVEGWNWIFAILAEGLAIMGCIVWGPVYAFSSERYPIKVRASAMGLFNGVDSVARIASSYLGSVAINPPNLKYMLFVNTFVRLIVAVTTLTLVKTDIADKILDFDED